MPGEQVSAIRRAAEQWIKSGVEKGYTGEDIIFALKTKELAYRREDMLRDISRARYEKTDVATFRTIDRQAFIPTELVREVDKGRMVLKEMFRADFMVQGRDLLTDEYKYVTRSLSFSTKESLNSLVAMERGIINESEGQCHFRASLVVLTNVFAKAVEDWEAL